MASADTRAVPALRRLSTGNDDEDEEELLSLGLSGGGGASLDGLDITSQTEGSLDGLGSLGSLDGLGIVSSSHAAEPRGGGAPPTTIGANRKSAFPATPAAPGGGGGGGAMRPARRTPGPPGAAGVGRQARHRRTPGAGNPHNEPNVTRSHAKTPVMSGAGGSRLGKTPYKQPPLSSSSLITPMAKPQNNHSMATPNMSNVNNGNNATMNDPNGNRQLYTPAHFALAKNADLHIRPEAFSPATIRMTDSLEKLLTDDDDYMDVRQRAQLAKEEEAREAQASQPKAGGGGVMFNPPYQGLSPSREAIASNRGAFRRIQSSGTTSDDESSDDEEMEEMKNIGVGIGSDDEEEEAEISQILDEPSYESGSRDVSADTSLNRSQPLNLSGGAFQPPPKKTPLKPVPKAGAKPGALHTPKPQWKMPAGAQHPNQAQGGGSMYYPQQQPQQQGFYGPMAPFRPEQPPPPSYQYPHPSHPPPPHQYPPQPSYHQNFHPPTLSPHHNPGFGMPSSGVVSPLTLPQEYGAAQPHYMHSPNAANVAGPYPPHSQQGPGAGGDPWAWSPHSDHAGYDHGGAHHGMHHAPGHASPDFSYHPELSGAASPFTLPTVPQHHQYPPAAVHHPNNYSQHYPPQGRAHHQGATRQRTSSKEGSGRAPSAATGSPGRKHQQRQRNDSISSINSYEEKLNQTGSSTSSSVLKQSYPGIGRSGSSEEHEHSWFYPSPNNSGLSFSTLPLPIGTGLGGAQSKQKMQNISNSRGGQAVPAGDGRRGGKKPTQKQRHPVLPQMELTKQHQQRSGEQVMLESPSERAAYKEFARTFRATENQVSLDAARNYALASIDRNNQLCLPVATHWRVHLELADVAKRSNRIADARAHYQQACRLQPKANQGWLEHSKLEEESGNLDKCAVILQKGLDKCDINSSESLLIRALKFYERVGQLGKARSLLARTQRMDIDRSWKIMLEGALLEARAGRYPLAREVLKHLTHYVPWYGPLYLAHTKLERDYGSLSEALSIVERGLKELPRYGPLYFQAFRLLEKEDIFQKKYALPRTMEMIARADMISRELLWKVHLEAAQMQERAANAASEDNQQVALLAARAATRRSYAKAIMLCPPNLCWKIWLASGRTEVSCGNTKGARDLFLRAYESVSEKGRSTVLLECARLEEFVGDLTLSRSILCKARSLFGKSDWKAWLSSVNLECRCGLRERAISLAQEALNLHRGTGRLWAALIQLRHADGELYQMKVLKCALRAVPKSGEVWCEGARIYLNPFSPTFDLRAASRHLSFAARFTPQYGDSFLEQLRLNMIDQWLLPLAAPFINGLCDAFLSRDPMPLEDACQLIADHTKKAADVVKTQLEEGDPVNKDVLDTSELELKCSSADPNYGHLWFQYRKSPIDSAREVIDQATSVMADSVVQHSYVYIAAMVRRAGVLMLINHRAEKIVAAPGDSQESDRGLPHPNSRAWDIVVDRQLRSAPALEAMIAANGDVTGAMFATGSGQEKEWGKLSLAEKRKILFGSESLLT